MKILLHTCWGLEKGFIGGTERFIINLAKSLRKRGEDAFVVCSNLEEKMQIEGVPVLGIVPEEYSEKIKSYGYANENFFKNEVIGEKVSCDSMKSFSNYVFNQLKEFKIDIVHLNAFMYSSMLPHDFPLSKTIVTNHENPKELENYWGSDTFKELCRLVKLPTSSLKDVRERIVPSSHYSMKFSQALGMPVNYIHLGTDINVFREYKRNEELRKKYANPDEILVLLPSRFDITQKGHDIAIKAASSLKETGVPIKCLFTGFDKAAYSKNVDVLDHLLDESGMKNNVVLTKFDHMIDAYSICDLVISPERFCSFGLAISEALALGLPTILSPIPTYQEIAKEYKHAHIVKRNEPEDFAKAMLKVINSGCTVDTKESKRFRDRNSFENCVDEYLTVYRRIDAN